MGTDVVSVGGVTHPLFDFVFSAASLFAVQGPHTAAQAAIH